MSAPLGQKVTLTLILNIMHYQTISAYMANKKRYIPEDSGEVFAQPDLSLSVRDIMERWKRDMPLDLVSRNGTYYVEGDNIDDDDFDAEDMDCMDPVDLQEYVATRADKAEKTVMRRRSETNEPYRSEPESDDKENESETEDA